MSACAAPPRRAFGPVAAPAGALGCMLSIGRCLAGRGACSVSNPGCQDAPPRIGPTDIRKNLLHAHAGLGGRLEEEQPARLLGVSLGVLARDLARRFGRRRSGRCLALAVGRVVRCLLGIAGGEGSLAVFDG